MPKVAEIRTEPAIWSIPLHQAIYCDPRYLRICASK